MSHIAYRASLAALAAALLWQPAAARNSCATPSADCVVVGEWDISLGLGAGLRSNPIKGRSDIPLVVLPQISYYGKRFFIESLELGFTLHETDASTLSLIATPGYDRVFFYRSDLQNVFANGASAPGGPVTPPPQTIPLRPRHTTYLAGPEWGFTYGRFIGQLDALYEVTGEHDGYEVRAAIATPLVQSKHSLAASTGFTWKSARVVRYYYGVDNMYNPSAAFSPFIKLSYSKQIGTRWSLTAFAHYELLGNAIVDSPIVADDTVLTAFVGFTLKVL